MENKITYVISKWIKKITEFFVNLDRLPLWWTGLLVLGIIMIPHVWLGQGSVFTVHDQLDESMMNYVLTARHPGADTIPEMLNGINASGLAPSAILYVLFYMVLPPFYAFMLSYMIMVVSGFMGMYLAVKELTGSSILATACAGVFCLLPLYPVYGLSQMGIPLVLYAFLCLGKGKHTCLSLGVILFFALTSHLVYTGYVVLGFAALGVLFTKLNRRILAGFGMLLFTYVGINYRLFAEILFGQAGYVSHREEMVNAAMPFAKTVWSVFTSSSQHAFTYHEKLILPIVVLLLLGAVFYQKLDTEIRKQFWIALGGFVLLFLIAVFFGICKSEPVVQWKNNRTGFLHYFQMERVYWLYPAGWYLELALVFSVWWKKACRMASALPLICLALLAAVLLPTANTVLHNSYFYRNVNQYNNGSGITGYISWESYYAEPLMARIENAIGRDMSEYRIVHLGISPAPALMHGFYTVDGYSNNYPLAYKHAFRKVIAAELDRAPDTAAYFDTWGNRCYLFNSQTGNYWMLEKGNGAQYAGLDFDMSALKELGCAYILSGAEIADADRMGLHYMGYFETEDSYWGIWLYEFL
ncbi:MAG: hypothetical protein IJ147_01410 [Lachnospiraceae bacterium]|nr:hypothetical protein [Lachnospiraceae bacterium]